MGNLISDFVKGKRKFDYSPGIQKGITLHRSIDTFTDFHPATHAAKEFFRPYYRLYSGAFVDVVYDHFLANDTSEFTTESLSSFSQNVYNIIEMYAGPLPERFAMMFPYMKTQDWLYNYRAKWGIEKSLAGVVRRSAYLTESQPAYDLFEQHFQLLQDCYRQFWADVKPFAQSELVELLKN